MPRAAGHAMGLATGFLNGMLNLLRQKRIHRHGVLREERPEVAFIALHGPGGEDGTVQELLEILGIPYTGPGVAACGRCADKVVAKQLFRPAGIPTPDWFAFKQDRPRGGLVESDDDPQQG